MNQPDKYAEPHGSKERIEEQLRIALGGHPDSELWGKHGLIAATMRCVEAVQNLDQLIYQWEKRAKTSDKLANDYADIEEWQSANRCKTKGGVIRSMTAELKQWMKML